MTIKDVTETDRVPKTVAYLRFWASDRDIDKKKRDIKTFADNRGFGQVNFVEEKVSNNLSWQKSKVKGIIDHLDEGDILIVHDMLNLSASMLEIREIISIAGEKKFLLYEIRGGCELDNSLINKRIRERRLNPDKKNLRSGRSIE